MENNQSNNSNFLIGALIGGAIASAATLILAPKSGEDLREDITDTYDDIVDNLSDTLKNNRFWGEESASNNNSPMLWGTIGGCALAAAVALWLAPKKQKNQITKKLINRFQELSENGQNQVKGLISGLKSNRRGSRRSLSSRRR
jgi:gas vesicle protein